MNPSAQQLRLVRGADGLTLLSSGVVVIAESWEFINEHLRGTVVDRERAWRLANTLNHEAVHFIQSYTTAFGFVHATQFARLCETMQEESRRGRLDEAKLRAFRKDYRGLRQRMTEAYGGVSAEDILEGMAVVEGYRASAGEPSSDGLGSFLKLQFPGSSTYSRVVQIVEGLFGNQQVLELTGPICFLALNSDSPPKRFWKLLRQLSGGTFSDTWRFVEQFGSDPRRFFVLDHDTSSPSHPVLGPYLAFLRGLSSAENVFKFCAQPGTWLRGEGPWKGGELMPPVVLAQGGMSRPSSGPLARWSDEEFRRLMVWVARLGASQRALADDRVPYMACVHNACPIHATGFCHHWYGLPERFEDCVFPGVFEQAFGQEPHEAASRWSVAVH